MFHHVVLFRVNDPAEIDEVVHRLKALASQVPVIRGLAAGRNLVPSERAYDIALIVHLNSSADLPAYANHPDHQALLSWIKPRVSTAAAVDFDA